MSGTDRGESDARSGAALDRMFMRRALTLARRGWGQTAPNPMVGAVVVRDGVVIGEGWHRRYGEAHAEVNALAAAGSGARGATVYVTLEPCAHTGHTPPCADALLAAGVKRVVLATRDPSPVASGGADRLRMAGVTVDVGIEESAARELAAPFLHAVGSDRPWVTLKLALTIDSALADAGGGARWITGPRARRAAHLLRAGHDAIAVGIGTVLADDPALTVRGVRQPRVPPWRVVFDRTARLPLDSALARTARQIPTVVIAERPDAERAQRLAAAGVEVIRVRSAPDALERLRARGVRSLIVEGGAALAGDLLAHALVHRLVIFRAPVVLGAGARGAFASTPPVALAGAPRWPIVAHRRVGEDTMTVYALREISCSPD